MFQNLETTVLFCLLNTLNAELNPTCHFQALLGAHHILHISRIRVNDSLNVLNFCYYETNKRHMSHIENTNKMRPCLRIYYSNVY
jgi:hypothetical protein